MLKQANIPVILEVDDYIELYSIPQQAQANPETRDRLTRWINQATSQFDNLISPKGQGGKLYDWWNHLDSKVDEDNLKGYKLQQAIASWVETFIQTGKFWTDGTPTVQSNFNIELNASSDNADVELVRNDIIQNLVSIGLYSETNLVSNGISRTEAYNIEEDLISEIMKRVEANYLNLRPQAPIKGASNWSFSGMTNTGNIYGGGKSSRRPILSDFDIQNCTFTGIDPGPEFEINSSKVKDDSATEPTEGINPVINDVKITKELIQKTPEGTKIVARSSDGTKQFTFEIDAKNDVADFDGLRVEGISSFNASKTTGDLQSDISILEDGSGVLIAREGDLEYYLTLNGANGFEIKKIENGSIVEYIPTDQQIVVGKNLSDLKIDVNGKVEGINGVITFDKDTIYEDGGLIKAKVGLTQEAAKLLFSNKVNYDTETGSKAILNATNGNEMEFKVGELAQPSFLLKQNGINMLNNQIIKTNTINTTDSNLISKGEVKTLIANSGLGEWKNIYDNGTLTSADDGNGNYYYVFTPNSSNLDQFTQSGENDYVAVPRTDLYFTTDLNKTFYDFSVVGDFSDLYGAGAGGIWLENTITIAANKAEKFQNKEFIVYVKAKESGTDIIYNSKVLKIDFNYLMTFKNGFAELQLNEQFNYKLEEYVSSSDTKPKISNGTWITSDKDFRINKTDMLDVGSAGGGEEVWEDIDYIKDANDNIIPRENMSKFSKIKLDGNAGFTGGLHCYFNNDVFELKTIYGSTQKPVGASDPTLFIGNVKLDIWSNKIVINGYFYKGGDIGPLGGTGGLYIKGVRK